MRLRVLCAIAFSVAALVATKNASAAEERDVQFTLVTSAKEGGPQPLEACGGDAAIELAVEERVHRRIFVASELSDITLSIAFATDGSRAIIVESTRVGVELGRREVPLPPNDCAKSLETIAVVLAIMVGPERKTTEPPPGVPTELPPAETEPPPPVRERPPPQKKKRSEPPAHWTIAPLVEMAVGTGVLPGVAWAIEAGLVIGTPVPRLFAIARAEFWPIQYTPTRPTAEVTRLGGALLGCGELVRTAGTALSLCGGLDAGRLGTESTSFSRTSNATAVLGVLAEARFGYRFGRPLGPFVVEPVLAAQVSAIIKRDRFTYRDEAGRELTLLKPAPLAIQGSLGVALHFF
jgi:hypothetical protein